MKENEILENQQTRDELIERTEVLDKVKELILLPNTEFATTEQVATYFGVTTRHVEDLINKNKDELISDGFGIRKADDFITELNFGNKVVKKRGKFEIITNDGVMSFAPRGVNLFPKRAILRMAMLLRDSEIAKEIRTRLLDIVQDASEGKDNIINNVIDEIDEEKLLMSDRVEAEMKGDYDTVCIINAKLFALKNKRIAELETNIESITTHALDIIESRKVINSLVRKIGFSRFNGKMGVVWNDLYSKINYKLGINIKSRKGKPLDTLSEHEMYEVEKIVRTWANDCGIDINKTLSLKIS